MQKYGKGFSFACTDCDYNALYILTKKAMERGYPLSEEEIKSTIKPDFPAANKKDTALGMMGLKK